MLGNRLEWDTFTNAAVVRHEVTGWNRDAEEKNRFRRSVVNKSMQDHLSRQAFSSEQDKLSSSFDPVFQSSTQPKISANRLIGSNLETILESWNMSKRAMYRHPFSHQWKCISILSQNSGAFWIVESGCRMPLTSEDVQTMIGDLNFCELRREVSSVKKECVMVYSFESHDCIGAEEKKLRCGSSSAVAAQGYFLSKLIFFSCISYARDEPLIMMMKILLEYAHF